MFHELNFGMKARNVSFRQSIYSVHCSCSRATLWLLHTVLSPSYTGVVILLGSTWALPGGCFAECPLLVTLTPGLCPTWAEQTLVTYVC